MKQRLLSILLVLMGMAHGACILAADNDPSPNAQYLNLMVNGKPVVVSLAEHPVITYTSNTLHIATSSEEIDIPVESITGCDFSASSSINSITEMVNGEKPLFKSGYIHFSHLPALSDIVVYTVGGQKILTVKADSKGEASVDLNSFSTGTYIIKTIIQTLKVTNKK